LEILNTDNHFGGVLPDLFMDDILSLETLEELRIFIETIKDE